MSTTIEVLEGAEGKAVCQVRGSGPNAGQKVRVVVRIPCATSVSPLERKTTLPKDGSLSPKLEFSGNGAAGKTCKVAVEVFDRTTDTRLVKREKVITL